MATTFQIHFCTGLWSTLNTFISSVLAVQIPHTQSWQVLRLRLEPNEELRLRQALKHMESRRASVEQCATIRAAVAGEAHGTCMGMDGENREAGFSR